MMFSMCQGERKKTGGLSYFPSPPTTWMTHDQQKLAMPRRKSCMLCTPVSHLATCEGRKRRVFFTSPWQGTERMDGNPWFVGIGVEIYKLGVC